MEQGGPGCASMYGNFYILGPWWVNDTLQLVANPGKAESCLPWLQFLP